MSDEDVQSSNGSTEAAVIEVRVATLKSSTGEERRVHWELMEDGELVNMGEWQIPRDQDESGPKAWEDLILQLAANTKA